MPRRRKSVAPITEYQVLRQEIEKLRYEIGQIKQAGPSTMATDDWEHNKTPVQGQTALSHPGRIARANASSGITVYHDGQMRNINSGANYKIKIFADDETVEAGDKAFVWGCPEDVDLLSLCYVEAYCTDGVNSGVVQVDMFNITQTLDMLTTSIEIDSGQHHSHASTPLPVINAGNAAVDFMDLIRFDIDSAGAGRMGLAVNAVFL